MPYTEEQRAEALRLYVDEGPDIAAQQTGISVRTIYRWAAAEGVSTTATSERTQAATTAAKARAALNRAELHALLLEQAVKALHSMDEEVPKPITVIEGRTRSEHWEMVPADPKDKKELALTAAVLLDKFRLESGEATGRTESLTVTDGLSDDEKRRLREAVARAAGAEAGGSRDGDGVEVPGEASPAATEG